MRPVLGRERSRSSARAASEMPSASLAAPPGQWTPRAPAVTAPPGSWHVRPTVRMPYGEPRPIRPEFFGYPPHTASAPAGYPAHPHHRRPVTPPKAGRARSPSQHRRRRKGDRPRRTRQGRREDEEVRPAEIRHAEIRPAEVHPAEAPSAAGPARASDAAPPPTTERDEKAMFQLVLQSSRDELSRQLHQAIGDHDATAFFKDGLSALQAYMLFVLHYLENYLTTAGLHAWPVISHNNLRSMTDRVAFTKTFSRPWNEIQGYEVAEVVQFLISRFVNQPSVPIGEREIGLLAKALLASKIPYQQMFARGAQEYAAPEEALHVREFPVQFFPGPAVSPNQWYVWAHGTTPQGLVGILTAGRVFRSDAEVVGTPKGEDCFSFYGKAMQWTNWAPSLTEFLTKAHHSTKNSSGVVVGGYLGSQHVKSKSAQTTHESHLCKYHCLVHSPSSDKRWAIREAGARIDRIWVLSSTHWSSSSSIANPFLPGPALLALDDDWGKNWPSPTS